MPGPVSWPSSPNRVRAAPRRRGGPDAGRARLTPLRELRACPHLAQKRVATDGAGPSLEVGVPTRVSPSPGGGRPWRTGTGTNLPRRGSRGPTTQVYSSYRRRRRATSYNKPKHVLLCSLLLPEGSRDSPSPGVRRLVPDDRVALGLVRERGRLGVLDAGAHDARGGLARLEHGCCCLRSVDCLRAVGR